jgi:hypothetical protein
VADENIGAYLVLSSACGADENIYHDFRRLHQPTKISTIVFVGWTGRRKYLPSFLSAVRADENSFIFVGFIPSAIFNGFRAIFDGFLPMKLCYFLVV